MTGGLEYVPYYMPSASSERARLCALTTDLRLPIDARRLPVLPFDQRPGVRVLSYEEATARLLARPRTH